MRSTSPRGPWQKPAGGLILSLLALLIGTAGCRENGQQMDVQLNVRLESAALPVGGPVELTYRWQVAPEAEPVNGDYLVFTHCWGEDGEIQWQDDHQPPVPTSQWRPGQIVEYRRIHFTPDSAPPGKITITAGLYDQQSNRKIKLIGNEQGERRMEYEMARFELLPSDQLPIVIYDDGWYNWEIGPQQSVSWRWCRGKAVCWVESPGRPCSLFLEVQAPVRLLNTAQQVTFTVEETPLVTLKLDSQQWVIEKIPIPEELTRDRDCFRLAVSTEKVATPIEPGEASPGRELGLKFRRLVVY